MMLTAENATVTLAHSRTKDLASVTRNADIVIASVGKVKLITADMIKPGASVIDVGINRMPDGKVVGDVDFEGVREVAGLLTPVPGGVGLFTIAFLLKNILTAYKMQVKEAELKSVKSETTKNKSAKGSSKKTVKKAKADNKTKK
jgi:methylenetetrahydrofolate dehydrogenase (NADP+)/methenyltetrahydrofolate cyclohydrolase